LNELTTIPFQTINGDTMTLADFGGKVVLVVNVASKCGSTPQYAGLETLYEKYSADGFVVIGFPANNFKNQEPGTNEEIQNFCSTTYGVTFPLMSKISVLGKDIHPLYRYLTENGDPPGDITWNFNKFLIDKQGNIAARFDTKVTPNDSDLVAKIEALLKK
jgi:glutathione peroxidase